MDDSIIDSIYEDEGSSEFNPEPSPKPKAKATARKPAAAKTTQKKIKQTTITSKSIKKLPASNKHTKRESEYDMSCDSMSGDGSTLSHTPPRKPKIGPTSKSSGSVPLADLENESFGSGGNERPETSNASDKYQKLTQLEHIVKRPDTYIGSVERTSQHMWVYSSALDAMEYREVSFVPGLYKIFDEIVVNAADNKQNDKNMSEIRVTCDRESGAISIWNNGRGIPIEVHSKERIYVPELIFGHLLTSSNYDDSQEKVTGGRNGFGAKLCNVFSTEFIIETQDSSKKKRYKQTWTNNMTKMGKAKITDAKGDDYTKVTFTPDYARFGMDGMDDDFEALVKRRVYDLAGTSNVTVKLNGSRIGVRNFKKYMEMYTKAIRQERGDESTVSKDEIITCNPDPRWEIGFAVSSGTFQQVSFVNSIATTSGGTHVNYIADQICGRLAEQVKKKNRNGATLKTAQIKNHIFIFVNAQIVNPSFTSQTKEQLTTKVSQFGSKCVLEDDFFKKILKTEVMSNILHFAERKADQLLTKSDGGRRSRMNNAKLTDANKAGTKDGHHCTLILTEGDSAKGLAMAGRAVVGPDLFGVFPLRGKLLNVRDASFEQISKNQEIQNIKNFIGLQHKKEYKDTKGLRYGHLMIMTDQDHDGSHIKGLLINFLQAQFPSLLKIPEFLVEFITPIIKVWKGDPKNPTKTRSFFTIPEYELWKEEHKYEHGWDHKYYKGLGTSSTEDAEIYFRDLDRHLKEFHTMQDNEAKLIDLAFSKKKADDRKEWLRQYKPGTYLDHTASKISYTDFINKELILFSMADNIRSIPSVVDGLKPGQRKVLYTCFRRNLKKDMKVIELSGHVSGMTAYQHGDVSLQQTIVGLAQNFVGSNNVNCLEPSGNFGSRLQGGSDCASARYIYTRLSPFARRVFHADDEPLLKYLEDDGEKIEPETYMPVVPMILINGADGIGTGWSSSIPNYNPEDIVANLKRIMDGKSVEPMQPWFRGFTGEITALGADRFKFTGVVNEIGENEVEITELPIRSWTQDFKDKLEDIIKAEKAPSFIRDYKDYNTHTKVHFVIQMDEKHMKAAMDEGLEEKFKLSRTISTTNLVAFDPEGRITKYSSVDDILKEFYGVRLKFYEKRKQYQLNELQKQLDKLSNQARFVQMIIDGDFVVSRKKRSELVSELGDNGFKPFPKVTVAMKAVDVEPTAEEEEEKSEHSDTLSKAYDYLLGMPIWSLTQERVERLRRQIADKEMEIDNLIKLSKEDIWRHDLDEFINEWKFQLEEEGRRARKAARMGRRLSSKLMTGGGRAPAVKKRKAAPGEDSDEDFAAPKSKKAALKKVDPKGSLLGYLTKPSTKPAASSLATTGDSDSDFATEILPKKKRGAKGKLEQPLKDGSEADNGSIRAGALSMDRDAAKPVTKYRDSEEDDLVDGRPLREIKKPTSRITPDDNDAHEVDERAKKARGAAKAKLKPKDENIDNDFIEIAREISSKSAPQPTRTSRKPVKYTALSDSDHASGDDLMDNVSKMVKGITRAGESAQIFTDLSQLGSSESNLKATAKVSKSSNDFGADETNYGKLVPLNSPRRSLQVKSKEIKMLEDNDEVEETEPVKPAARVRPVARGRPAAAASKSTTGKASGRSKKDTLKAVPAPTAIQLSPTAKAYASRKGKAIAKRQLADVLTDDDIDMMANDILASPKGDKVQVSEDEAPVSSRKAASRPARRTAAKKTYVIDDDSEEYGEEDSGDNFDESSD